mgnify:FL=1
MLFDGLKGWTFRQAWPDVLGGATLAAITVPEQMATAKLGGFAPQVGFYAFIGATIGLAVFGRSRVLTGGADSTITPIFALTLAGLATAYQADPGGSAVVLAVLVGILLLLAGLLRLGFVASLLSTPVVTGFLAGIAVHIVASQLPAVLGVDVTPTNIPARLLAIVEALPSLNPYTLLLGLGTLGAILLAERIDGRIPGALIGVAAATAIAWAYGPERLGVATLGAVSGQPLSIALPPLAVLPHLIPLALLLVLVIMMQVSAVDRGFAKDNAADTNADFIGLGAGNLAAAMLGAFPVNASPPRTAVAIEAGVTSQLGPLVAAGLVTALVLWGGALLGAIPEAALAGVLLFVAARIFRFRILADIMRRSPSEALLSMLTVLAIVALPIQSGMAIGIVMALLHGVWMTTHTRLVELARLPGTTIWWPMAAERRAEHIPGVLVVAFQAPLLFSNADTFERQMQSMIAERRSGLKLVVLEASAVADIDYTAADTLQRVIADCQAENVRFVVARLQSVRAASSLERQGVLALLGETGRTDSVEEAVRAMISQRGVQP